MNTIQEPLILQKIEAWWNYGVGWVVYVFKVLYLCLLTPEGWAGFRYWPWWVWGVLFAAVCLVGFVVSRIVNPSPRYRGKFIRGTKLVATRGYWWKVLIWSSKTLVIGKVRWPKKLEPLHLLVTGAPSTGKSQAIHGVIDPLRRRGELAIVADVGGEAMSRFVEEGDHLLNPLDERSEPWSPFAEMESATDSDRLSKSMIPDLAQGHDQQWIGYAQALVSAVLRRLWEQGNATNGGLLYYLTAAEPAKIKALVEGLPAQSFFHAGNERLLSNVRGIVGTYLAPYIHLPKDGGPTSWSIRRYMREGQGWLWLPYQANQVATLRPLLATWLGEVINALLSMPSDLDRRRWLLLDEVASLGCVQDMSDALTKGRKHGLCAILGLQSVAQLRMAYGDDGEQTLLSCLSSQLILRANDPETAKYASEHLGKCELERTSVTRGSKIGESSSTRVRHTEDLVLPSEIQALPDRRGYLRLAGENLVRCVKIPLVKRAQIMEPFVPRASAPPAPPVAAITPSAPSPRPPLDPDAILKKTGSE
jgi:hypothetical protein